MRSEFMGEIITDMFGAIEGAWCIKMNLPSGGEVPPR